MIKKVSSLVLLRQYGSVLLGWKKRGFGAGKWNGFGGKVEEGETMLDCAKRELFEESGMLAEHLEEIGSLVFEFVQDPMIMNVTVFTSDQFTGEPRESEEMKPKWFAEKDIPYNEMWIDDKIWFPLLLKGIKFRGYFKFLNSDILLEHHIEHIQ